MQAFIAALISFFLIEPLGTEFRDRLEAVRAPQAIITGITTCIERATPALADRAWSDPWWFATTSFNVWTGLASLETVTAEAAPACSDVVRSAAPFLREQEG